MHELELKQLHFASVSGGKDSLYMMYHILNNLDKYPLDGVVHYELEIDFPFIKNVINEIEKSCVKLNIPFYRITPTRTWEELYEKYYFPTRKLRWCNSKYKLSGEKQFKEWLKKQGYEPIYYIGLCANEEKRLKKEIYPLYNDGIYESTIWEWAKNQPIFDDYYKYNYRCGCMYCPCASMLGLKYLSVYYPENYKYMMEKVKETELKFNTTIFQSNPKYNVDYYMKRIENMELKELAEWKKRG